MAATLSASRGQRGLNTVVERVGCLAERKSSNSQRQSSTVIQDLEDWTRASFELLVVFEEQNNRDTPKGKKSCSRHVLELSAENAPRDGTGALKCTPIAVIDRTAQAKHPVQWKECTFPIACPLIFPSYVPCELVIYFPVILALYACYRIYICPDLY